MPNPQTLAELVDRFMTQEAPRRYSKRGTLTRQADNMQSVLNHFMNVPTPASSTTRPAKLRDVDPNSISREDLRAYIQHLESLTVRGKPIAFTTVTKYLNWCKTFLRWAVCEDLVGNTVMVELNKVRPPEPSRSLARITSRVTAVPEADVRAAIAWCRARAREAGPRTPTTRDRVRSWRLKALAYELMWETGMRPGELVQMRPCDLAKVKQDDEVWWTYKPPTHKTEHHGQERVVWLSAMAQLIIQEAMEINLTDDGVQYRLFLDEDAATRRLWPWHAEDPDVARGNLCECFKKALKGAGRPVYTTNQIRHAFGTRCAPVNLEGTRAQMGHQDTKTTRRYIDETGQAARDLLRVKRTVSTTS